MAMALKTMWEQHDRLAAVLRDESVEIAAHARCAALGMPILRTINGAGIFEGGSFAMINEQPPSWASAAHRRRIRDGGRGRRAHQSDRAPVLVPREAEGAEDPHGRGDLFRLRARLSRRAACTARRRRSCATASRSAQKRVSSPSAPVPTIVGSHDASSLSCWPGGFDSRPGALPRGVRCSYHPSQHSRCTGRRSSCTNQAPRFSCESTRRQIKHASFPFMCSRT
jgi:hypothetical protein